MHFRGCAPPPPTVHPDAIARGGFTAFLAKPVCPPGFVFRAPEESGFRSVRFSKYGLSRVDWSGSLGLEPSSLFYMKARCWPTELGRLEGGWSSGTAGRRALALPRTLVRACSSEFFGVWCAPPQVVVVWLPPARASISGGKRESQPKSRLGSHCFDARSKTDLCASDGPGSRGHHGVGAGISPTPNLKGRDARCGWWFPKEKPLVRRLGDAGCTE